MNERKIPYCLLGPCDGYPENIPSDVDFMIPPSYNRDLHFVLKSVALENDAKLIQAIQHETTATYYVLCKFSYNNLIFFHPDSTNDYLRNGNFFLSYNKIIDSRTLNKNGFYVPAPEFSFIYYLIKKIDKGEISAKSCSYISKLYNISPINCSNIVNKIWTNNSLNLLINALHKNEWSPVRANLEHIRRELNNATYFEPTSSRSLHLFQDIVRKFRRIIYPTGFFVAVLGPDGSGKTTIISNIASTLAPAFRKTEIFHLRPTICRAKNISAKPVTNPHEKTNRGAILSIAKIIYFLIAYLFGYLFILRPKLIRSSFIIFDRYYHDILVDPKRFRFGAPPWVARFINNFIPKPDLLLILDVKPNIVRNRKIEVSNDESERQYHAYRELIKLSPNTALINANGTIRDVVKNTEIVITEAMEQRLIKRMKIS